MMEKPDKISFMYEVSRGCNQRCRFCYNAWKISGRQSDGELGTGQALDLLAKVIDESGCSDISLSGGEPLLREDIFEIISFIKKKKVKVSVITNGTLLTRPAIDKCVSSGVDSFQITLLSDRAEVHNHLSGLDGFGKVVETIVSVRDSGIPVYTFFAALKDNIHDLKGALELNALMGVRNVALGRFIPGGAGLKGWEELMPDPDEVSEALEIANQMCKRFPISVSVSTPILPCLHDISRYGLIKFSFCAVGNKEHSIFGIDPLGNLKVCSHSSYILGNLLEKRFEELMENQFFKDFTRTVPAFCRDCPEVNICKGGCRSSAHLCFGSLAEEDPYLKRWKSRAKRPKISAFAKPEVGG